MKFHVLPRKILRHRRENMVTARERSRKTNTPFRILPKWRVSLQMLLLKQYRHQKKTLLIVSTKD